MKIKRNKKSYNWFLCGLILVVVLTISYRVSKANYRISNSIELTTAKVISRPYDLNIIGLYIDGVEQDKSIILPNTMGNYSINEEETYCYKANKSNKDSNAKISINVLGELVIKGISKGSKCILSLNTRTEEAKTMSELLVGHYTGRKIRQDGAFEETIKNTTYGVMYEAPDDDGTSYYFAGNPLDNWVEFGEYYWRIIRVNGDGSIRVIYQGRAKDESGNRLEAQSKGEETQIGISAFNENNDDNAYVGFMYGTPNSSTYEETHANINDSTIKQVLDNWFNNSNLKQEKYFNKIDLNAGFCGDRTSSTSNRLINNQGGMGTINTFYGGQLRFCPGGANCTEKRGNATYSCNNNDLYTYSESNKGNKKLVNPVGLITADEVTYAGGIYWKSTIELTYNTEYYLNTSMFYYTLSPFSFFINSRHKGAGVIRVEETGNMGTAYNESTLELGVRPVINLRSDVEFTGIGTQSNPYKVVV